MFEFIGAHLGEIAAVLAVAVSAYTAWSRNRHDKEQERDEDSRITAELGDSVLKLIQPLNERIDELVKSQDDYIKNINSAITVLKECRFQLDKALESLEKYNLEKIKGTREIAKEIKEKINGEI